MKKISTAFLGLSLLAYSALPAFASGAVLDPCPKGSFNNLCTRFIGDDAPGRIVGTVIQFLLIAAVVVALFYLIYGGIRWITSGGDKGKVDEARKHVIAAIVGLIIAFVAFFVVQIILNLFGLGSVSRLELPTF